MGADLDPDPTYSSIENPTANYPRDTIGPMEGEEFGSWTATPAPETSDASGRSGMPSKASHGVSWLYLALALVGGGMLAVGVSGIVGLVVFAGS